MAENENRPLAADGVAVESLGLQFAAKAVALAKLYTENQDVCSWGLRFILHNGLDYMRNHPMEFFETCLELGYHAGTNFQDLSREDAMRAFWFAKELASLPESVAVAFFAATAARKDLQKTLEQLLECTPCTRSGSEAERTE